MNYIQETSGSTELKMIFCFFRNPNEHQKQEPVLAASRERNRFRSVVWDEYDSVHQKYLEIGKSLKYFGKKILPIRFHVLKETYDSFRPRAAVTYPCLRHWCFNASQGYNDFLVESFN